MVKIIKFDTKPSIVPLNIIIAAFKQAERSDHPFHKHGAVLYNKSSGHIIAIASNKRKFRHHAEARVLSKIPKWIKRNDIVLFTGRWNIKQGHHLDGKPCYACERLIIVSGIKQVIHT